MTLAALVAALPARFTAADRIEGIAPDRAGAFLAGLADDAALRAAFLAAALPDAGTGPRSGQRSGRRQTLI